ncbi:hypothetical protein L6164_029992 [Bauhinia variegata]|uniref:Uncharacterized protein n=1 Tax=Bauhinia variegata TaxID=167791 RepID=A0ACB9LAJ3_BAUVA|nr:hypothetical protein L6164_029992 [Bauhinia variegata]
MNLKLSMVIRPISFVILLAFAALIVVFSFTPCWYVMVKKLDQHVSLNAETILSKLKSEVEQSAKLLQPMNSSATNLARFLSSTYKLTNGSFSEIETKAIECFYLVQVSPVLFQAFQAVPHLDQISYIGLEGLFLSYYTNNDQILAIYSNSSFSYGWREKTYYIQPVNRDTGELYDEAVISKPFINACWVEAAVNSSYGYASLGTKWSNGHDLLFLSSARITGTGLISLGFPVAAIIEFITLIDREGASLYLGTKDGTVLAEGIPNTHIVFSDDDKASIKTLNENGDGYDVGTISCKDEAPSVLNIHDTDYLLHCSQIDIMGVKLVYALVIPQSGLVNFSHKIRKQGVAFLTVMLIMILIAFSSFIFINARAARREMHLCASLIKQMEATQQAERKSMNKTVAFANASHDVRAYLAGLTGLIELCYQEAAPGSELVTNLKQMDTCTKDLLGLLNSILDTSKIEAGKMQLDEEEFDVSLLLEDVVDLYHPVAMKNGVDLVLDSCNGSVIKYSRVKGDRGKLKQVLCNLLSNAVKFTEEGHITVRAWAQKPSFQNSIIAASNRYGRVKKLTCLFGKKDEARDDLEAMNSDQQDLNSMEFVFEVDDTGKGIPKDKQKSVFENYVQVKETGLGQGGTGLGLGIVQSLVRLMHGDIGIVDKDNDEKGTCFRFNVFLSVSEVVSAGSTRERESTDSGGERNQPLGVGLVIHSPSAGSSIRSYSPRFAIGTSSPKPEASRVVLLIQDKERQEATKRFMETLGIRVKVVKQWEHLFYTLNKIKQKNQLVSPSSSGGSELGSRSNSGNSRGKDFPLSSMDGTDQQTTSVFKKTNTGSTPGFVLIVIDALAGPFSELCRMISSFRRGLRNPCKVVWLDKGLKRSVNFKDLDEDMFDPNDFVITKPFHGSRLFNVIKLLPEYGGTWQSSSSRTNIETSHNKASRDSGLPKYPGMDKSQAEPDSGGSSKGEQFGKETHSMSKGKAKAKNSPSYGSPVHQEQSDVSSFGKPLSGKKFLLVEDAELLRKIALATLVRLGGIVEQCTNGAEAVRLVEKALTGDFPNFPYDYIIMDCEMPVMNGFEATRRIREMERLFGIHIPIIALTAHTSGKEASMTIAAGMDVHLNKPVTKEHLLEAIRYIHSK